MESARKNISSHEVRFNVLHFSLIFIEQRGSFPGRRAAGVWKWPPHFFFSTESRPALKLIFLPKAYRRFLSYVQRPGRQGHALKAIWFRGYECVELNRHCLHRRHNMLNRARDHLSFVSDHSLKEVLDGQKHVARINISRYYSAVHF
jgi:hypothetical protein